MKLTKLSNLIVKIEIWRWTSVIAIENGNILEWATTIDMSSGIWFRLFVHEEGKIARRHKMGIAQFTDCRKCGGRTADCTKGWKNVELIFTLNFLIFGWKSNSKFSFFSHLSVTRNGLSFIYLFAFCCAKFLMY